MSRFSLLLEMLDCAFDTGMTEENYHDLVECLKMYNINRDSRTIETHELQQKKWPLDYHPCDHMENIRWGAVFLTDAQKSAKLTKLLQCYMETSTPSTL